MLTTNEQAAVQQASKDARTGAAKAQPIKPLSVHDAQLHERELLLAQRRLTACRAVLETAAAARSRATVAEYAAADRLTAAAADVRRQERAAGTREAS